MTNVIKNFGYAPYQGDDDTRKWIEAHGRKDGKLKPSLFLRVATDTNYIQNAGRPLYGTGNKSTKAMMNLMTPCTRLPGVINWSVQESADQLVQSASCELFNCIYISRVESQLQTALPADAHSPIVVNSWVGNSLGVVDIVQGNTGNLTVDLGGTSAHTNINPANLRDADGYYYREDRVKYRRFAHTAFDLIDASEFPDPSIPLVDDDNDVPDDGYWPKTNAGTGSYFLLIDNEIVRVIYKSGNRFYIPPGGRGIGSEIAAHPVGARVRLLGIGQRSGEWAGMGYLNVDDFKPQTSLIRPGTCITAYEGWGDISPPISHDYTPNSNYCFTGYWFVSGVEPSIDQQGIPRITLSLKSAGWMLDKQKITPDLLRRAKTQFGQWRLGQNNATIWGDADHDRDIPGDWVDYDSWEPALPSSYPLKIKVELAQNKEFYDHMTQADFGNKCELCRQEHTEWLKTHSGGGANSIDEQRAIGKHIYKSSIRVLREEAGPIKTYIRLMATLAMAAWDHPAYGTELAQSFSKIPNRLFDNVRNIYTGLVFNGQLSLNAGQNDDDYDWFSPTYDDAAIVQDVQPLIAPFEATYDKTPFTQPMTELAEINGNNFWITREGYPVFKPKLMSNRPNGQGYKTIAAWRAKDSSKKLAPGEEQRRSEWFHRYGASISGYSTNIDSDNIITQCWVTATSAFQSEITVLAGGTGKDKNGNVKLYSSLGGNSEGLALTSGVQQVETLSLDNRVLGLDWNTKPAGWGVVEERDSGYKVINALPDMYEGQTTLPGTNNADAKKHPSWVKKVQRTINFFLTRQYMYLADSSGKQLLSIQVDGKWGQDTVGGVTALRTLVGLSGSSYTKALYDALTTWLSTREHYIQFDIYWYVVNRRPWEEYLAAITGLPIQENATNNEVLDDTIEPTYVVNDTKLQTEVGKWTKTFSKSLVNAGNKVVDESLNKAVARTISSNFADPRIIPGDVIWADIPGFLTASRTPPFTNGIYVTSISRQIDLVGGTYTATYSGHRFMGNFSQDSNAGYGFIS